MKIIHAIQQLMTGYLRKKYIILYEERMVINMFTIILFIIVIKLYKKWKQKHILTIYIR